MRPCLALLALILTGCSRYGEFTLPSAGSAAAGAVSLEWERTEMPVLPRAPAPAFDSVDTLNPSVVRHGGRFWNLYSGYDGKAWHTGLAHSADGKQWSRAGKVLSPDAGKWEGSYIAANGSALHHRGRWMYWYQGGSPIPKIGLATSSDGRNWTRHPQPVLTPGPRGSWDERGVGDPYVIAAEGTLYLFHLGQDRARRQRIGVARSSDGMEWQKLLSGPVLELGEAGAFDDVGLGESAVWSEQGWWWMLYTARDRKEFRRLGLARSRDGIVWERVTTKPVFEGVQPWEAAVVCDPSVLPDGSGGVHVWYGGGDRPEPAENLNGQIGYARLRIRIGTAPQP